MLFMDMHACVTLDVSSHLTVITTLQLWLKSLKMEKGLNWVWISESPKEFVCVA